MRRLALVAALLLPLGACDRPQGAQAANEPPPPMALTAAQPVVKEVVEDDEFVGRFEAAADVEVRARVSGYLDRVHFRDGALVAAGDLLFTIDQRTFRTAQTQAEAQLRVAEASFTFAEEQFQRAQRLSQSGNIAQSAVDERRQDFLAAQARIEDARAAVEGARIALEFTEIRAPIGGRIGRANVTPGNLVRADDTVLTTVVAQDPMHFYFDIDERYFLAYARDARARGGALNEGTGGLPVRVTLADADIPPREGRLDFAENRLDRATGTMRVRAVLPNPDGVLQPGLFGRANVPGSLPYRGVLVPDESILADQNRRFVYVVNADDTVTTRDVRPGPRIDGWRVIREGLDGSETIAVDRLAALRPGMAVAPERVTLAPVRPAAGLVAN
jgi:RND family efflux transporter MFP subunit